MEQTHQNAYWKFFTLSYNQKYFNGVKDSIIDAWRTTQYLQHSVPYDTTSNTKDNTLCLIFCDSNWPSRFINLFYALHFT